MKKNTVVQSGNFAHSIERFLELQGVSVSRRISEVTPELKKHSGIQFEMGGYDGDIPSKIFKAAIFMREETNLLILWVYNMCSDLTDTDEFAMLNHECGCHYPYNDTPCPNLVERFAGRDLGEFRVYNINDIWDIMGDEAQVFVYEQDPTYVETKWGAEVHEIYFAKQQQIGLQKGKLDGKISKEIKREKGGSKQNRRKK